jgi:Ca-activated chloride channel homolog
MFAGGIVKMTLRPLWIFRPSLITIVAISTIATSRLSSQEQPLYKSGTRTVPIYATVLDARGRLVPNLGRSDFSVVDDGKPTALSVFSKEPQPFTAVVMLDTSASMTANLEILNRAAEQFVLRLLPHDRAQVGAFNDKIQLSGTFTNDRDALVRAIGELQFGNPTRLHDAIAASLNALRGIDGRRVVLVFTDGDDTASRVSFKAVLERARDEEVMVYAIGLESAYFDGTRLTKTRPSRDLRRIAEETGGGYFELIKTDDLGQTFSRVAEELRSQYLLGFAPARLDGKLHKLDVRVVRPGMTVRARRTYLAAPEAASHPTLAEFDVFEMRPWRNEAAWVAITPY